MVTFQASAIALPRAPEPPKRSTIPILASVAPVIAALALWALTRSPFAMVFALIGPVVALASFGDSRRRNRIDDRREHNRFERELVAAIHAVEGEHARERDQLNRHAPSATVTVASPVRDSERWRGDPAEDIWVRLGTGPIKSSTQLRGESKSSQEDPADAAITALFARAATLEEAPITVDAALGIGVCGAQAQSHAVANALIVQLAHSLSPLEVEVEVHHATAGAFGWVVELPHASARHPETTGSGVSKRSTGCERVEFRPRSGGRSLMVATAARENILPLECRVIVHVSGSAARLVRYPVGEAGLQFAPEYVSDREAIAFARVQRAAARALSRSLEHSLATSVAFNSLAQVKERDRHNLSACIGVDSLGDTTIDLVRDGPHAVVGGTTGSGKSELLITWILAMASSHSVEDVNFLLVDFKGGASFSAIADLPHTVGVLTDLDEIAAHRAIVSLRAELSRRERVLAEASARSMEELEHAAKLARLVIVVDEFATLTNQLPELHELFADLAARGRSLGIHLILCTQRPAASVRDAVLANCSLRVSLRVTNHADSVAVIGTTGASQLPRNRAGRALISRGGGKPELVQLAMATCDDVVNITNRTETSEGPPHRPWLDPLPGTLPPSEVPAVAAPALAFGMTDVPDEQRRVVAVYDPVAQGNLMILGGRRSGKTGTLAALAHRAQHSVLLPTSIEGAWDSVTELVETLDNGTGRTLLLVDNVDELLSRFPPDYESAFVDRLSRLAREGPRRGVTIALTASGIRGRLQTLAGLCESTLVLRMPSKQEHIMAGGLPHDFESDLHPGAGQWGGRRVQVLLAEMPLCAPTTKIHDLTESRGATLAVISSRPASLRSRLEKLGTLTMLSTTGRRGDEITIESEPTVLLGDPDAWQASWVLLAELRSTSRLAFHDCSLSDFRAITRGRQLPPPVDSPDTLVVMEPDGRMFRAVLAE